jgi:hypothetical protein
MPSGPLAEAEDGFSKAGLVTLEAPDFFYGTPH